MDNSYEQQTDNHTDHSEQPEETQRDLLPIPAETISTERPTVNDSSPSNLKGYRFKHESSIVTPKNYTERSGQDNDNTDPDSPQNGSREENDPEGLLRQNVRKLKRDIQENLNAIRLSKKLTPINVDLVANLIADDYAEFLKTNEHDSELFGQLCEDYTNLGEVKLIHGATIFEEKGEIPSDWLEQIIDLGAAIFEAPEDHHVLLNPETNHIGLGIGLSDEKIVVVALMSSKLLTVDSIREVEGGIELCGKMLVDTHGLYAVRVQKHETKKELSLVGPENIEFSMKSKEFVAFVGLEESVDANMKILELYVRRKPETIEYKRDKPEKLNLNHLELALRYPCIVFPQDSEVEEDRRDKAVKEQNLAQKKRVEAMKQKQREEEAEERKEMKRKAQEILLARAQGDESAMEPVNLSPAGNKRRKKWLDEFGSVARKSPALKVMEQPGQEDEEGDMIGDEEEENEDDREEGESQEREEEEEEEGEGRENQVAVVSESTRIGHELGLALEEAENERIRLEDKNIFLQRLVCELREKKDLQLDRQSEVGMTEGKYLNTLAHVHQIRQELRNTQDRYNAMAKELQAKLEEKQQSCYEIRRAFKSLMKEVSKNATNSRTDKPIPERRVLEWEEIEDVKALEVQELRLENIKLRNQLANNQKVVKKKEELADGLHLIDYEQLKIENQTLCEKIEERNEDLHRMKKNNANVVQILTHIKEKLQFQIKMNEKLGGDDGQLEQEMISVRTKVSEMKKEKQRYKIQNEEMKQQTGIMTNKHLRNDFQKTCRAIRTEGAALKYLEAKFAYMTSLAQESARKNKWKKTIGSPVKMGA